ncbi:MAG: cation:proton antiporter [Psychromonas sp.]
MHLDTSVLILIFVILSLLFGALVKSVSKIFTSPYSVVLLIAGLGLGLYSRSTHIQENLPELSSALTSLAKIDPHLILLLFLPTLIFESAFAMETHLFKRMFSQIAILAVPGLILTTTLTATLAFYFFPWQWSWLECFLFGALISATDPVAVVSLLKEVSSRKRLETLIEGESLLNDGTAIVLFTLFYGMLTLGSEAQFDVLVIASNFLLVCILGAVIGLVIGGITLLWIGRLFNQPIIEITLTISAAYISYFIAENIFHVSGVVAVVALGLLLASIGRTLISPEVAGFLHHFWQMMAHIANTLIFILVGIIIASRIRLDVMEWWLTLIGLYIAIQAIRAISVFIFMPILKRIGIGLTKEKALVLIWGGLRGAVSLALALIIAQDTMLPKEFGDQILFLSAGIVVLTIVINSSTMTILLRYLGLDKLSPAKQASLDKAQSSIRTRLVKTLPRLQEDEFLVRANWKELAKPLADIPVLTEIKESDLGIAFRRRLLEIERQFYWSQFKQGALTGPATKQLVSAVEGALDSKPEISPRTALFRFWKTPRYIRWFNHIHSLNNLIVYFSFERLALRYETARGFIQAQEELQKHITSLCPSELDKQQVMQDIEQNKKQTRIYIQQMRENFPELSYRLETHTAHRLLLNLERAYLDDLISEGVLDESESKKLTQEIELKLSNLKPSAHHVSAKNISKKLGLMHCLQGVKAKTIAQLGHLAQRQIYNEQELIYKQNKHAAAVAIILHGKVELICVTNEAIVETGALIGSSAFITTLYTNSAKSITPVELIWLDIHKLQKIIAKDKQLAKVIAEQVELDMQQ